MDLKAQYVEDMSNFWSRWSRQPADEEEQEMFENERASIKTKYMKSARDRMVAIGRSCKKKFSTMTAQEEEKVNADMVSRAEFNFLNELYLTMMREAQERHEMHHRNYARLTKGLQQCQKALALEKELCLLKDRQYLKLQEETFPMLQRLKMLEAAETLNSM